MSVAKHVLRSAEELIQGDRDEQYGPHLENHKRIAQIWSAITGVEYSPETVAAMMIGLKLARLGNRMDQRDSWVDIAGYAALGWDMASSNSEKVILFEQGPVSLWGDDDYSIDLNTGTDIEISTEEEHCRVELGGGGLACDTHPDAPHGFDRDASHSAGRYTSLCEAWGREKNA